MAPSTQRNGGFAQFAEARKATGRLLPDVQRHLLTVLSDRDQDHIHPSEIADPTWCPRALYHRLRGVRPTLDKPHFQLENIFDEGHHIHDKWQSRWRAMGVLWGCWKCGQCAGEWLGMPPSACPSCGGAPELIKYKEVPLFSFRYQLLGHADGEVRDAQGGVLIEIKSIGEGTVRQEAPKLVAAHTLKVPDDNGTVRSIIDHARLWKELRRPFSKHLRQGYLYLALREMHYPQEPPVDGIDFIYEYKPNQSVKEMHVRLDREVVEEILEECLDLIHAVRTGTEPWCRQGRKTECAYCTPYVKEASGGRTDPTPDTRAGARVGNHDSGGKRGTVIPRRPPKAEVGAATGRTRRPVGTGRPGFDLVADEAQSMGGLFRWPVGAGRE